MRSARRCTRSWKLRYSSSALRVGAATCTKTHYAPEPNPYAINRYDFEAWRHWKILDAHLADRPWMLGERYTLMDMAVWGSARAVPFALGAEAWQLLPHVKRLLDAVNVRPWRRGPPP